MIFTERLRNTLDLAATLHRNHKRIGKGEIPYITHLIGVALILIENDAEEDTVVAGLMHDTVEDIEGYEFENLENDCGIRVREIVEVLTEPREFHKDLSKKDKWVKSKTVYLKQIEYCDSQTAMVSAADKIHNLGTILSSYKEGDEVTIERFGPIGLKGQIWFASEVYKTISEKIPSGMSKKFLNLIEDLTKIYKEKYGELTFK